MALTFRTPVEEVLARFTSEEQSRVSSAAVKNLYDTENANHEFFNFSLSERAKERLTRAGLYLSPYSFSPHSHPVCKTLENHLLYTVLPSLIDSSFTFVGIKNSKLQFLKNRYKKLSLLDCINRYVTSVDKVRYGSDFVIHPSAADQHLARKSGFSHRKSLVDLVPEILRRNTHKLFLHDEIHYWSPDDLVKFLDCTKPDVLIATAVIPPELLVGATESLNPWAYKYKIFDENLHFAPDGCWQEAYYQPLACTYLLRAKCVKLPDQSVYNIDLVHSKFCHHMLVISKGDLVPQSFRSFSGFDAISLSELQPLGRKLSDCYPVNIDVVMKIYLYLRTLKKPDLESAEAKLRQLIAEPSGREVKFVEDLSSLILGCSRSTTIILPDLFKSFRSFLIGLFPDVVARNFKCFQETSLDNFIYNLEPFNFKIKTVCIQAGFLEKLFITDLFGCKSISGLAEEASTMVNTILNSLQSPSTPYSFVGSDLPSSDFTLFSKFGDKFEKDLAIICATHFQDYKLAPGRSEKLFKYLGELLASRNCKVSMFALISNDFQSLVEKFKIKFAKDKLFDSQFYFNPNEIDLFWFLSLKRKNLKHLTWNSEKATVSVQTQALYSKLILGGFDVNLRQAMWKPSKFIKSATSTINKNQGSNDSVGKHVSKASISTIPQASHVSSNEVLTKESSCADIPIMSSVKLPAPKQTISSENPIQDVVCSSNDDDSSSSSELENIITSSACRSCNGSFVFEKVPDFSSSFKSLILGNALEFGSCTFVAKPLVPFLITDKGHIESSGWGGPCTEYLKKIGVQGKFNCILAAQCDKSGRYFKLPINFRLMPNKFHSCFVAVSGSFTLRVSGKERFNCGKLEPVEYSTNSPSALHFSRDIFTNHEVEIKSGSAGNEFLFLWRANPRTPERSENALATFSPSPPISKVDLLKKALNKEVWKSGALTVEGLIESKKGAFAADLCSCFSCNNYFKFNKELSAIALALQGEGMARHDKIICFKGGLNNVNKLLNIFEVKLASFICLDGSAKVLSNSVEIPLKKYCWVEATELILEASDDSLCIIAFNLSSREFSSLTSRAHQSHCIFSGAIFNLLGCPVRSSFDYNVSDFNLFHVPGDGDCFWHSVGHLINTSGTLLKEGLKVLTEASGDKYASDPNLRKQLEPKVWAENESIAWFCYINKRRLIVLCPEYDVSYIYGDPSWDLLGFLQLRGNHFEPCLPINGCMIIAIAEALNKREVDVLNYLCKEKTRHIFEELCHGRGLNLLYLEEVFEAFDICGKCDFGERIEVFNPTGSILAFFDVSKDHIKYVKKLVGKPTSVRVDDLRVVKKSSINVLSLNGTLIKYSPEVDRAERIQNSLLEGRTGVISDSKFNDQSKWFTDVTESMRAEREILVVLGTFGSGKSYLFKEFIKCSYGKFVTFVSPRRQLADSIKEDLNIPKTAKEADGRAKATEGVDVVTFEIFLRRIHLLKREHFVIIDEVQLFPPGFLDLCLIATKNDVKFAVTGDPCQSFYDNKNDRFDLGSMASDIHNILEGKAYSYNILSQRFRNPMFEGRLPCNFKQGSLSQKEEDYFIWNNINDFVFYTKGVIDVVLVSSFDEKKIIQAHLGMKARVLTFGESTGLNFNIGAVLVSIESYKTDDRRWLTALSRFRSNIHIINVTGISMESALTHFAGKPLYHFLAKKSGNDVIRDMLPGTPKFTNGFQTFVGKSEGEKEAKLSGDPWLKTMLFLGQTEDQELEELQTETMQDEWFKTHFPITSLEAVRARWVGKLALREDREVRVKYETTQQFTDEPSKQKGLEITNACERFEAIYPRHHANDSITFLLAVKKRLSFSRPDVEAAQLRRAEPYGEFLLQEFLKKVPLKRNHNSYFMEKAVKDFEDKKCSKSEATIENHSGRSCRDWLSDVALIFMKAQLCTKFDNRFRNAKAGQTLACFSHSVLVRFAPYMRYIEMKLMEVLPSRFYIHSGKSLEQLNQWVIDSDFSGICTESDYEAFDASQDHYILAFELALMKFFNLPDDLIADYKYIKIHLGSKLGNFSIMRFTGEASTFLFNTMANMLFTFLNYDLTGSESIAFAGDDMCANKNLRVSSKHTDFLKKLRLKAKVQKVSSPTFCGWCLFKGGIYKRPQLVLERINIARELNNLHNCIDNYAIEVSYAYNLGEQIWDVMTEEEAENHQVCVRFLIKHRHLMKSSIAESFSNAYIA